ncbi:MAG: TIGR00268 family protein [Bacteroidetes bacterium]|nr:TIGR00268 family protein [Bacteroidota bacterium]
MTDIAATYQSLLADIAARGQEFPQHLVAFSGGVDSSLVAKAVFDVFPQNSTCVMALSPSVAAAMRESAVALAAHIGIPLRFVETSEHLDPTYIANDGMSCYVCKSSIYDAMEAVYDDVSSNTEHVLLYNGTNADDFSDPTRVGLQAAREHMVQSPLARFTKADVRMLSRHAGLPNWDAAASPCLRSRLHIGVPATAAHLLRIEAAEEAVRLAFRLTSTVNFRVRHLPGDTAMLEIDAALLDAIDLGQCSDALTALGFRSVEKRAFRSGSVSAGHP